MSENEETKRDRTAWLALTRLFPDWWLDSFGVSWSGVSVKVTDDGRGWLVSGRKRPLYDVRRMVRAVEEQNPLAPLDYDGYMRVQAELREGSR